MAHGSAEGAHDFVEAGLTVAVTCGLARMANGLDRAMAQVQDDRRSSAIRQACHTLVNKDRAAALSGTAALIAAYNRRRVAAQ